MEEKKFIEAVTIFIDILGTRDRSGFNEWYRIASIFHDTVEREKKLDEGHKHTIYKREIHMFSDCAYIIYDFKDGIEEYRKDIYGLMTIACYNTEKVLYEFLKNGFIARGALTYGEIYYEMNRSICFGPAMNKAYDLESHIAKYPRVIIDPEYEEGLIEYNNKNYRNTEFNRELNGEIIKQDEDNLYYIHYLNTMELGLKQTEDKEIVENTIEMCKRESNKDREDQKLKDSITSKYNWLKRYVQESCYSGIRTEDIDISNPWIMKELEQQELRMLRELGI